MCDIPEEYEMTERNCSLRQGNICTLDGEPCEFSEEGKDMVRITVYTKDGPLAHYDGKDLKDAEEALAELLELHPGITNARFDNLDSE